MAKKQSQFSDKGKQHPDSTDWVTYDIERVDMNLINGHIEEDSINGLAKSTSPLFNFLLRHLF